MPIVALLALGFSLGAALATGWPIPAFASLSLAALLAALWIWLMFRQHGPRALLLLSLAICTGMAARDLQRHRQLSIVHNLEEQRQPRLYAGLVLQDLGVPLGRRHLLVETRIPVDGRVHMARVELRLRDLASAWPRFAPGDEIRFRTKLRPPRPAWMPGQTDFRALDLSRDVLARGSIWRRDQLLHIPRGLRSWQVGLAIARLRQALLARMDSVLTDEDATLLRAVVLGDRSGVDAEVRHPFDGAGAGHLLAVSGLHVGAFAGLIFLVAGWLSRRWEWLMRRVPPRRFAALAAAPCGLAFALLAGASPSALRAGIMVFAVLIGVALWRDRATLVALGFAALAILGRSPAAIADPGFVLSFATVLAILLLTPRIGQLLGIEILAPTSVRYKAMAWLAASMAAGFVALPLGAYYFGRVAPWSVPANALIIPLAAVALPVAIAASLLGAGSGLLFGANGFESLSIKVAASLILALRDICAAVASLPAALVDVPHLSLWAVLSSFLAIFLLLYADGRRRWQYTSLGLLSIALLLTALPHVELTHRLRVDFLPVGQGDATLIRSPGGQAILVDGGALSWAEHDVGQEVILPMLRHLGVHHLDAIVRTHPDADHYNGLVSVITADCPDEFWQTDQVDEGRAWTALEQAIDHCGSTRRFFDEEHHSQSFGELRVDVLHPLVATSDPLRHWSELGRNDNSLVLLLRYGNTRMLLTGDAGALTEASLVEKGLPHLDLLKCGHHGSKHSTTRALLNATRPTHAVISAGYSNRFGHPSPAVLKRLSDAGTQIWRTDRHGWIQAVSDGEEIVIRTFRQP